MSSQRVPVARSARAGLPRKGTGATRAFSSRRHLDRDARIFGACALALAAFFLADALIRPATSNDLARRPLWLGVFLMPVLWLVFVRGGRVVRMLLAALIGLGATVIGVSTSVAHAVLTGASGSDYLGVLATVAGLVLLGLALRIGLAERRLALKLTIGIAACFIVIQWGIAPAIYAGIASNATRPAIAHASSLGLPGARDVAFISDGVVLSGWYVPGRNRAAVILLHGSHGTRADTLSHLRMLARAGYAVLAYDARGHGQSTGQANAFGWSGVTDLAAAVRFLKRQPGIDPHRIAALGLSMGAEESLRAAADGIPLAAVIADGAGASTLGDERIVSHSLGPVFLSETWLTMRAVELATGDHEPAALKSVVGRVRIPVLLIASNARDERAIDATYRGRIGPRATLWYVPDAEHTGALARHPGQYDERVTAFLTNALGSG